MNKNDYFIEQFNASDTDKSRVFHIDTGTMPLELARKFLDDVNSKIMNGNKLDDVSKTIVNFKSKNVNKLWLNFPVKKYSNDQWIKLYTCEFNQSEADYLNLLFGKFEK